MSTLNTINSIFIYRCPVIVVFPLLFSSLISSLISLLSFILLSRFTFLPEPSLFWFMWFFLFHLFVLFRLFSLLWLLLVIILVSLAAACDHVTCISLYDRRGVSSVRDLVLLDNYHQRRNSGKL